MRPIFIGILMLWISVLDASADAFTLRMSDAPTVVPGQLVTIVATLINNGAAPIVFDDVSFHAGITPRQKEGSGEVDNIDPLRFAMDTLRAQFVGVVVDAAQAFQFTFATLNFDPASTVASVSYFYNFDIGSEAVKIPATAWRGTELSFSPDVDFHSVDRSELPEPETLTLLALGVAGVIAMRLKWAT